MHSSYTPKILLGGSVSKDKMIYVISDTHFNHEMLVRERLRPFKTIEEMNESIIAKWNKIVKPDDTIYHLGDVVLNQKRKFDEEILPRLNGNIIFIRGNHDPINISCVKSIILEFGGKTFELIHNPNEATFTTDYIIHGHIHKPGGVYHHRLYNCNVEFTKYQPKLINEILGELSQRSDNKGLNSLKTIT